MNEWIVAAIEREAIRRGLLAHNEYVRASPSYSNERWQAKQAAMTAAPGDDQA
jgi:hypothetical protein